MMSGFRLLATAALLGAVCPAAHAETLTIGFVERPGYATAAEGDGQARGLLVDITRDILTRAGIQPRFVAMPQKRLLKIIESGGERICNLGGFKTPDRAAYSVFTKPIYRSRPISVVILAERAAAFAPFRTLAELTAAPNLNLGYMEGFSYGPYPDRLIATMSGAKSARVIALAQMVGMLAAGRFDYLFADSEIYEALANAGKIDPGKFRLLSFPDVPEGNWRYLMCSKAVSKDVIDRIDAAIGP